MLHLVFDGAWANAELFWWPLGGWSFGDAPLPEVERGWWSLVLEAAGAAALVWIWRRSGLSDAAARRRFRADGRLFTEPD